MGAFVCDGNGMCSGEGHTCGPLFAVDTALEIAFFSLNSAPQRESNTAGGTRRG